MCSAQTKRYSRSAKILTRFIEVSSLDSGSSCQPAAKPRRPARFQAAPTGLHSLTATVKLLEKQCFQQLQEELGSSMIESFFWNVETRRSHTPHPAASPTYQGSPDPHCNQQSRRMATKISLLMTTSL